jgi:hypothetical protein
LQVAEVVVAHKRRLVRLAVVVLADIETQQLVKHLVVVGPLNHH